MLSSKINLAIIGTGRAASKYAVKGLLTHPDAEIVAVSSKTLSNAQNFAQSIPSNPSVYPRWEDMMNIPGLNAVVICTPPSTHYGMAVKAMEAGYDVMVEKPSVISEEDAGQLLSVAMSTKRLLCVHQPLRFSSSIWSAKKIIEDGKIGNMVSIDATFTHPGPQRDWFYKPNISGGGALLDLGIHLTDAIRFLTKDEFICLEPKQFLYPRKISGIEEFVEMSFVTKKGINGKITVSWISPLNGKILIYGERGSVEIHFRPVESETVILKTASGVTASLENSPANNPFYYFINLILDRHVVDSMGVEMGNNIGSLLPVLSASKNLWASALI